MSLNEPPGRATVTRARHWRDIGRGIVVGILLVFLVRAVLENTALVDRFVAPLGRPDNIAASDVIVVLGASLTQLCTSNLSGMQRVLLASDLYARGLAPMMLITGGYPTGSTCSIAEVMAKLAQRLGVPADRIRVETTSASTWENALRSDAILRVLGARRILLVSDRTHLSRAEACFRRFGYDVRLAGVPVPLGHTTNTSLLIMGVREYAAWALYRVRGYVGSEPAERALVAPVPAQSTSPAQTNMSDRSKSDTVVVLGASYAKGWNLPQLGTASFANKGVEGQQSWEMLERFDRDVAAASPRAVILWGFINDVFRSPRPDIAAALERVRASYLAMIDRAQANGIEPILATEVTVREKAGFTAELTALAGRVLGRSSYQDYVNRHVLDTNVWLREVARQRGLLLLDLQKTVAGADGARRRAYASADGSHISPDGYAALTRYAEPILRSHLTR